MSGPTLNQSATPVQGTSTTKTILFSGVVPRGDTLVLSLSSTSTSVTVTSVTPASGNSGDTVTTATAWTSITGVGSIGQYLIQNTSGGSSNIGFIVTLGSSVSMALLADDYTNVAAASFDQAGTLNHGTSTGPSCVCPAPAVPGELAVYFEVGGTINSWNNGITEASVQTTASPHSSSGYLVLSSSTPINGSVSLSASSTWAMVCGLLKPAGIFSRDSGAAGIASTLTANSPCAIGDLIVSQFELDNVSAGNAAFQPTITDTVNTGNYTVQYSTYYAAGTKIYGWAWIAANAAGTPVVSVTPNAAFSVGEFNYIRWSGFTATPTYDGASANTSGTANPITGGMTPGGINEAIIELIWNTGGGNIPSTPSGWTFIPNASGAGIVSPFWLENTSPGAVSFSGTGSVSAPWYTVTAGFSSGSAALIAANSGSFAMTGEAAILVFAQPNAGSGILLANPGAFDWVGAQNQSLFQQYANTGFFAFTGQAANLNSSTGAAFSLLCNTGFFTMTGIDAVLQGPNYLMSEFTGYFALTGFPATLTATGQSVIPPGYEAMPNLVGLDWLGASAVLWYGGFAELQPEIVKGTPLQMAEAIVIGQTPSAYAVVPNGCAVTLSVASSNLVSVSFESH